MPKIKHFNEFTGWLNANTTNVVGEKDLVIAKNVFYNAAGQLQTRRGYRTFGSQIGSSPITSYFSYKRDDTGQQVAVCTAWSSMYALTSWTRNAIANDLIEFETMPWRTTQRTRWDFVVYKNTLYMCDGVNPYCSYDWTTFTRIGVGSSIVVTADNTTDTFTKVAHWLAVNDEVYFTSTLTVPTGITTSQVYYIQAVPTADTFKVSTTPSGTVLDFTTNWTGIVYYNKLSEPRIRYLMINQWVCRSAWEDKNPMSLYYSDPLTWLSNLTNINTNVAVIGSADDGIINWLSDYAQWAVAFKSGKIYYASIATGSFVSEAIDSQTGGYSDRAIAQVKNSLMYYNERWLDDLAKRVWVNGAGAIESQSLSSKVRDLLNTIKPISYNSSAGQYIREVNNYHFAFDSNQDDIPDTMVVYSSLTGGRSQYTFPDLYDTGWYIDSEGNRQYLFTSADGWQVFEYEYWFDDNGTPIEVEIQTKNFDFGDQAQVKTFSFVDVVWRKQEGDDINLSVIVDKETVGEWIVTDRNINLEWWAVGVGIRPVGIDPVWWIGGTTFLYPFTVRIPFYSRGSTVALNIQAEWVQLIFDRMRVWVDAETIDVFTYNNIL